MPRGEDNAFTVKRELTKTVQALRSGNLDLKVYGVRLVGRNAHIDIRAWNYGDDKDSAAKIKARLEAVAEEIVSRVSDLRVQSVDVRLQAYG